jgi:hypothetical protein
MTELAKKLAAHPKWPAMFAKYGVGMRVAQTFDNGPYWYRLVGRDDCGADLYPDGSVSSDAGRGDPGDVVVEYPDLADPATQGCLWAMLCESRGDVDVLSAGEGLTEVHFGDWRSGPCPRGEALARALLAVWGEA